MSARDDRPTREPLPAVPAEQHVDRGDVLDGSDTGSGTAHAAEDAVRVQAWLITTRSGSLYVVARNASGQWWFAGKNRPNPFSCALPPRLWRITVPEPWPPVIGASLGLLAPGDLAYDDPARVPGGGKRTSAVETIEALSLADALRRAGGHDGN